MKEIQIYTAGYQGRNLPDLAASIKFLDALLVDIRLHASSPNPVWTKPSLVKTFGAAYLHLPELGNINYKTGGPIHIASMQDGLMKMFDAIRAGGFGAAVMLCACKEVDRCHRQVVADGLRRANWTVTELERGAEVAGLFK